MAGDGQYENADDERKAKKKTAGIIVFVFLLISLAIFLFIYGFEVTFYSGDTFEIEKIPLLMMSTVFTLLGFGFLLSTYKNGKLTGFTIAIFVLSLNYILSPLFQKLWFIAFLKDQDEGVNFAEYYWGEGNIDKVVISPTTFRLANMCTISYLLGLTGLVGRISLPGIIGSQVLFNLTWHLNLHLNILMSEAANPKPLVYFDDYGTYLVYLFGAVFGLIASLLNRSNQDDRDKQSDRSSTLYTLIGSIFLFCTFSMAYFDIIRLHGAMQKYRQNAGPANIWFSMIAGVMGIYAASLFINRGKVGVREVAFGIIIGGITNGAGATYIENIGGSLAIGFIGGVFGGVLISLSAIRNAISDSLGYIVAVILACFLGGFIMFPIVILRHFVLGQEEDKSYFAIDSVEDKWQAAGFQLGYFGVSLFIALITGALGGLLVKLGKQEYTDYRDSKIFSREYGLFEESQPREEARLAAGEIKGESEKEIRESGLI